MYAFLRVGNPIYPRIYCICTAEVVHLHQAVYWIPEWLQNLNPKTDITNGLFLPV